jgi:P-type Ca2+ transporter type 2C
VTLALAFATKRMTRENLLVRVLASCETMANASVVCTDKTGTLTNNEMTVVAGSIGVHAKFVRSLDESLERPGREERSGPNARDFAIDLSQLNTNLTPQLVELFNAAIAVNTTAFEEEEYPDSGTTVFVGSKTEAALLNFAKELGWANYQDARDAADFIQVMPFSSDRKAMACVVRLPDTGYRLYVKGASEILAPKCTRHVVVYRDATNDVPSGSGIETAPIGEFEEDNISRTITFYSSQGLRTIALCYRDFIHWPPKAVRFLDNDEVRECFVVVGLGF